MFVSVLGSLPGHTDVVEQILLDGLQVLHYQRVVAMALADVFQQRLDHISCHFPVKLLDQLTGLALLTLSATHDFGKFVLQLLPLALQLLPLLLRQFAILLGVHDFAVACRCDYQPGR